MKRLCSAMAEGGSAAAELLHRAIAPAQRAPAFCNLASPVKNPQWREIDDWGGGCRAAQAGSTIHGRTMTAQPWERLRGGGGTRIIYPRRSQNPTNPADPVESVQGSIGWQGWENPEIPGVAIASSWTRVRYESLAWRKKSLANRAHTEATPRDRKEWGWRAGPTPQWHMARGWEDNRRRTVMGHMGQKR
jgi:hypothetical protein